jgi:DNA-binding helix-hairpin-helix protein with protein kinase domain
MKTLICAKTGQPVRLVKQIAKSGEGTVWQTDRCDYVAKIYFEPSPDRVKKLEIMVQNPPPDPNAYKNHISFAWATSLLTELNGKTVGFLMPAINNSVELIDIYSPIRRKKLGLHINWRFLHVTAFNLASIVATIHDRGYVVGDIKPQNILVNNQSLPSIIDTDSFQVQDPVTQKVYPCLVGTPEFTPPELIGKDLTTVTQTEAHDRFRLAVIIYYLLFGSHPFQGKWKGRGESPDTAALIQRGLWLYSQEQLLQPVARNIPIEIIHPELQRLFRQCFNEGHLNPNTRPSAENWFQALKVAFQELQTCQQVENHHYSHLSGKCYWCERSLNLGVDVFARSVLPNPQRTSNNSRQTVHPSVSLQVTTPVAYTLTNSPHAQISRNAPKRSKSSYLLAVLFVTSIVTSTIGSILTLRRPLNPVAPVADNQLANPENTIAQSNSLEGLEKKREDWRQYTGLYKPLTANEYREIKQSVSWVRNDTHSLVIRGY